MEEPRVPQNEPQRMASLRGFNILDTPPEARFDDLVQIAQEVCGTSIALMSLIDGDRQWHKSKVGTEYNEIPRSISFCGHAILGEELYEVPNAREDPRFCNNPLVTQPPNVAFYAGVPLKTSAGLTLGTLCVIDTTPRKLNEHQRSILEKLSRQVIYNLELRKYTTELQQSYRQIIASNSTQHALLTSISHEIQTPLNGIAGVAELLEHMEIEGAAGKLIQLMASSTHSVTEVLNDIVDQAKLGVQQLELQETPFNFSGIVDNLINLFSPNANKKGLSLEKVQDKSIQPLYYGDAKRIRQLLGHLIDNAIKFTFRGHIKIYLSNSDTHISINVADSGIGIPEDTVPSLFDKNPKKPYGSGLYICKQLVSLMNGDIKIFSSEERGTSVKVYLPIKSISSSDRFNSHISSNQSFENVNILLIDDHLLNQQITRELLERFGCTVHTAENLKQATKYLAEDTFKLILTNHSMISSDANFTTTGFRAYLQDTTIPIVAMSINPLPSHRSYYEELGIEDFIPLPIITENLFEILERWCTHKDT